MRRASMIRVHRVTISSFNQKKADVVLPFMVGVKHIYISSNNKPFKQQLGPQDIQLNTHTGSLPGADDNYGQSADLFYYIRH